MLPKAQSTAVLSLCLIGLTLLAPNRAHALNGTWTNTSTLSQNWTLNTNWSGNQIADGSGFTANFATGGVNAANVIVNLNGDRTIGNLTFGTGAQTITGSTLTLAGGTPTITTAGSNDRVDSNLVAASGFTKNGAGNFILGGASNTIGGNVIINEGAVAFGTATGGAGTATAAFTLTGTAALVVSTNGAGTGQVFQLGSLTGSAGTLLRNTGSVAGTNTFAIGALNTSTEFAGNVEDFFYVPTSLTTPTAISKVGAGTLTLSGTNTYTAGTTITAGTLQIGNGGTTGTIGGSITNNSALVFNRSNAFTFSGTVSGNGTLTQLGGGTTTLSNTNTYSGNTVISAGTLLVNGSLSGASAVQVGASGTLGGHGSVGAISGAGTVAPGNSPGILTALSVDGASGLDFYMELTALAPVYGNAANSLNDVLRLTAGTPFVTALDADNTVTVDFSSLSLAIGQTYFGGFYADAGDFASSISGANFVFAGADGFTIAVSTVQQTANFGSGNVGGWVTQFDVLAIPEPSTTLLLTAGLMVTLFLRRRSARTH